jgi:hypothetical protein
MSLRIVVVIAVVAVAALAIAAWNMNTERAQAPAAAPGESAPMTGEAAPGEAAAPEPADTGLDWNVPGDWTIDLAQGMRLATYLIPATGGSQNAECAVYYFGPEQGGGVDANLQRWMGEFKPLEKHDIRKREPSGVPVTRLEAHGTYVAHSMRGPEEPKELPKWALMGAVVEGPKGDIFFKLTGPAATVDAAAKDFDGMLESMRKK